MNKLILLFLVGTSTLTYAQTPTSYAPAADQIGTTALKADSSAFVAWATNVEVKRGFMDIRDTNFSIGGFNRASVGEPSNAIGPSNKEIVSLGDSGVAVLTFALPITNGPGPDFAVFENGFSHTFLELAHVEVSSDGINYVRFPSHSLTQTTTPIGGFGNLEATNLHNLAGKYIVGFGTPFDLEELKNSPNLDVNQITHVKIIDVIGSIGPEGTLDSYGNKIQDQFPTPFASGGFDLDAVGVIHEYDETNNISVNIPQSNFNIYPNPSSGSITLEMNNSDSAELFITNSLGKIMKQTTVLQNDTKIKLELPQGIYFIHLKNKDKLESRKVIIQ